MRIMWSSNAPWCHTGYGIQAKYVLPRLARLGHDVACFAWYGLEGAQFTINLDGEPIAIYPKSNDPFGRDVIGAHVAHFDADVVITLMDIWVQPPNYEQICGCAWAPWFPVDHDPVPPAVLNAARGATFPITYSRFGEQQMKEAGVRAWYVPHGVDTEVFVPGDKAEARKLLGFPEDAFIVDMVAANKGYPARKAFAENIQAFARFQHAHPEAYLYLHTEEDQSRGGLNLGAMLRAIGIPKESYKFVNQYEYSMLGLNDEYMANVYRASDCHLGVATNEGFGIPILEAQACGCPVLTLDITSMTELTWNGVAIPCDHKTYDLLNSWIGVVEEDHVLEGLETIYQRAPETSADQKAFGVSQAQGYGWDAVVSEYWQPLLDGMAWYLRKEAA